jgi:hypothetical protein
MEKYGFVYLWFDKKRKMFYVGSHWGTEDDGYICSSNRMRDAYRRRSQDFKRKIIGRVHTDKKSLLELEEYYLNLIKEDEIGKRYYNLCRGGTGHWSAYPEKVKTLKEKISHKTKEAMARPEVREKYLKGLEARDNKSSNPEVRKKRSVSMKSKNTEKWKWEDNIKKAHEANRGRKLSDEHKKKVSEKSHFKTLNSKKVSCVYCGKESNVGAINRWHNNNCKLRAL